MSGPWKYVNYTIERSSKNPVSGTTNYSSIPGLADWIIGLRLDYDDFLKFEFEEYLFNNATWLQDCLKRADLADSADSAEVIKNRLRFKQDPT
jgi:hypothetical protein